MRRPWRHTVGIALLLCTSARIVETSAAPCDDATLLATTDSSWRVACDNNGKTDGATFDPSAVESYLLTRASAASVVASTQTTRPAEVHLPSSFHRVAPLESSVIKAFTLKAEPQYVHTTPVHLPADAFAELHALETLTLRDVPLANKTLHLLLPPTIKEIRVVGCRIEQFSLAIVGGKSPSSLRQVDLYTNELVEIPSVFYSLAPDVTTLDIRLNRLPSISVTSTNEPILQRWMKTGVLHIDNVKAACPSPAKKHQVQGLSQDFSVCVLDTESNAMSDKPSGERSRNDSSVAGEAAIADDAAPGSVHSPREEPSATAPARDQVENTVSQSATKDSKSQSVYIALVAVGAASGLLAVIAMATAARHRSHEPDKDSGGSRQRKGRSSMQVSAAVTEDLEGYDSRQRGSSSSSDSTMVTPLPDFTSNAMARQNRPLRGTSDSVTPISANALYATLSTPLAGGDGYIMSKSLQSLTGVSQFSITSSQKESELRRANKQRLRCYLEALAGRRGTFEVSKALYVCFGQVSETDRGALTVRCQRSVEDGDNPSPSPLMLKVYVEQDVRIAIREYHALLVMQSHTCKQFISQMVATEMEKMLDGLKCAVMVVEQGGATTFRHIVRGQIDRTNQFEVVQQLYFVIKALECLHERQFIHGALHMDALATHTSESPRLKFKDLEHATRFGDTIQGYTPKDLSMLEYIPPEMTKHLLCSSNQTQRSSNIDTMEADAFQVLRASPSFDVWCLGIVIIKLYANRKTLDEFDQCAEPADFFLKLTDDSFSFEQSLKLYIHHEDVRDLAMVCLRRDPRQRPRLSAVLGHRVFRAYDRLEEGALVASFTAERMKAANKSRESLPPSLWFFLPPRDLELTKTRSIDEWITDLTQYQETQRQVSRFRTAELMFPLVFICEDSHYTSTPCTSTGYHQSRLYVPASLLSLAMPLVQESTLFLEAKSILSENPKLNIAQVSGLGVQQWNELMNFYRALEKMRLAPVSSFSLLLLKPLEELLASKDKQHARQVLDEIKCLVFSQEKRDHVLSLLDILRTISVNAAFSDDEDDEDPNIRDGSTCESDDDGFSSRRASKQWSRLRKCDVESEASASMPIIRWLCQRHWDCEMECEV